jgi:transcriptional antiterminator RfaH
MIPAATDIQAGTWIAASTHHFKEAVAIENLARQGYRAYCPMIRRKTRHARRLREVIRPLFPGYVFVQLDLAREQWRPILSTIGVRALIRFGDTFGVVPEAFLNEIRGREQGGVLPMTRHTFEPGKKVRMCDGPFSGLLATVLAASESDRLLVLMDLLNRSVRVRVNLDDVAAA